MVNLKEILKKRYSVDNILSVDLGLENSISHCWKLRSWKE